MDFHKRIELLFIPRGLSLRISTQLSLPHPSDVRSLIYLFLQRSALRSELSLLRTRLRDSEAQREQLHEQLLSAEKHADRIQSKSLSSSNVTTKPEHTESTPVENGSSPAVSPA